MSEIPTRVRDYLDASGRAYEVIPHHTDHTALQTAWDTHTLPAEFAKTVFLSIDGVDTMAVIPAAAHVSASGVRSRMSAASVRVLDEAEIEALCPDCELGAAPPFGALYLLPVLVSPELLAASHVTFNGGTHRAAIRMRTRDFDELVKPERVVLTEPDLAG